MKTKQYDNIDESPYQLINCPQWKLPIEINVGGKQYKKNKTRRERIRPKKDYTTNVAEGDGYYAKVIKRLGGNQLRVKLSNGTEDTVVIPGRLYKKQWIKQDMIVLVNNENEIIKIIRDNDKDATTAHDAIDKLDKNKTSINIYQESSSDDDDDVLLEDIGLIKSKNTKGGVSSLDNDKKHNDENVNISETDEETDKDDEIDEDEVCEEEEEETSFDVNTCAYNNADYVNNNKNKNNFKNLNIDDI